jgi:small subunit ribosomal protein S19
MTRTRWKGPLLDLNYENLKKIKTIARTTEVIPKHVGLTLGIHTGKKFIKLTVTEEMLGYKFGSFALTRGQFSFKKKKLKK